MLPRNKEPPNAIHPLFVAGDYVSAVADGLPALPDHHANPGPGPAAVLHAVLPHRAGKRPPGRTVAPRRSMNDCPRSLVTQRDLLGIQRLLNSTEFNVHQLTALLDCRGLHKVRPESQRDAFFCLIGLFCSEHQCHMEE